MTTSDDDISPIVVSLMGTDCATFASTNKLIIGGLLLLTQQGTSQKSYFDDFSWI
ncbi:MAG: hypothetical protein CM15mP14_1490 [Rhodospirillaceae bacterium]|nr:MAG: hypothetical protein CM15mP14_1490 [Rhodospirillaceae bacterium]